MKTACPRCGANVSFIPSEQKFYCEYCNSQIEEKEFNTNYEEKGCFKIENYQKCLCSSCGAQLLVDDETTITDCVYCGSRQIMKEKFVGEFNPSEIIPFKIDKDEFVNIYKKFIKKKILAPENVRKKPNLVDIKGVYVPYNLVSFDINTYMRGKAETKQQNITLYKYLETEFSMKTLSPQDASKNFDDDIMSSLEPFNFNELRDFNPIFLNGFLAETGTESIEHLEEKAGARSVNEIYKYISVMMNDYKFTGGKIHMEFEMFEQKYVLLPVWLFNVIYEDKRYLYAVNGQTGKIVGDIPLSKKKYLFLMTIVIITALCMTIFSILKTNFDYNKYLFPIAIIWSIVGYIYMQIKMSHKNVKPALSNSIQTFDVKQKSFNEFEKYKYIEKFGDEELTYVDVKKKKMY